MSSYMAKARCCKTGDIVDVACFDDYFGRRVYGYQVGDKIYRMADFMGEYEFLKESTDERAEFEALCLACRSVTPHPTT